MYRELYLASPTLRCRGRSMHSLSPCIWSSSAAVRVLTWQLRNPSARTPRERKVAQCHLWNIPLVREVREPVQIEEAGTYSQYGSEQVISYYWIILLTKTHTDWWIVMKNLDALLLRGPLFPMQSSSTLTKATTKPQWQ